MRNAGAVNTGWALFSALQQTSPMISKRRGKAVLKRDLTNLLTPLIPVFNPEANHQRTLINAFPGVIINPAP
jgi:hypothetical protein